MSIFTAWLNAGVKSNNRSNSSHIRLSNAIALLFAVLLVLQLGLCARYWQAGGRYQAGLILIYTLLTLTIPLLNHYVRPAYGRWGLIVLFISYIGLTSLHLGRVTQSHDFLLLGLFLCPFLFAGHQRRQIALALTLLAFSFGVIELGNGSALNAQDEVSGAYQAVVNTINRWSFLLAALPAAYLIHQDHSRSWDRLANERQRSENLLLSILPATIAKRLQRSRQPVADYFDNATVLFADIEGFSKISKSRPPKELVHYLNSIYSAFDQLLKEHGLEKIKTNGDEYMAVSGVPEPDRHHADNCCRCALAMLKTFNQISRQQGILNGLRIGINSGDLIAGVIGKDKFSYDLWGDNVNLASRMESQGQSQQIQVSETTYQLCKPHFRFIYKGEIAVKGMGTQRVYWLDQKSSLSARA